ncbi:uncharacterized protein LOC135951410 [Calliphora vicina]|uniref:uncharacterized protein LOC135951410 n=1 Tax=Calliphora vicina TaxID=7373 RepID=UPI00325B12C8
MIIVLLLFFKSICLYCQRLVLHVHDRWINPKNVRLLREAAEANGSKFQIEEYRQSKKSKRRRCTANNSASGNFSPLSNSLADNDSCRFCANTPQGYCRHHFHLQELHVQKQQRQQKFWCPLSGVVGGPNRSTEFRQLRKIKRDLKRNIQQQQQHNSTKAQTVIYERSTYTTTTNSYPPPSPSPPSSTYQSNSVNSSYFTNDSGYQTISVNTSSTLESEENSDLVQQHQQSDLASVANSNSTCDYVDIDLPSPSASLVETTYSFETCCETPRRSSSSIPKTASYNSFVSCDYSTLSTSYL